MAYFTLLYLLVVLSAHCRW